MVESEISNACRRFAALKSWSHLSPGACAAGYHLPPLGGWMLLPFRGFSRIN
jgi:hypothetical protein